MEEYSLQGTGQEMAVVYERNVDLVYRLSYLYLKNSADAEDATQSVFLKLLQSDICFEHGGHEKAWLITTTKNYCKDIRKSWWKRQRSDIAALPELVSKEEERGDSEIICRLLALPEKYRIALHLYYLEGYGVKEIAALQGRSESTIRTQLQRGREKLKIDLGGTYAQQKKCSQDS